MSPLLSSIIYELISFYLFYSSFQEGHIDLLSSDHSPTVPELKLMEEGDFLKAWGGISSLQVSDFSCSEVKHFSYCNNINLFEINCKSTSLSLNEYLVTVIWRIQISGEYIHCSFIICNYPLF